MAISLFSKALRWIVTVIAVSAMAIANAVVCMLEPFKNLSHLPQVFSIFCFLPCVFIKCPLVLQNRKTLSAFSVLVILLYNWLISFLCFLFPNWIINLFYHALNGKTCPLHFSSSSHSLILLFFFFFFKLSCLRLTCAFSFSVDICIPLYVTL